MAIMKQITKQPLKGDSVPRRESKKSKQSGIPPEQREEVLKLLQKGEVLRKDGRLMYRVPKSVYDGPLKLPSITAYSLDELRKLEKEQLDLIKSKQNCVKDMSLNDLFFLWRRLKRGVEQSTMRGYVGMYENHVMHTNFGQRLVVDIKKSDVRAFYNSIIDRHIMQARSLETLHNCLKQMFQLCIDDQLIVVSPVDGAMDQINRAAQKKEKIPKNKAMTVREQDLFLNYLNSHPEEKRWRRLFTCLLGTGMRIGELLALVWEDLDWDNNIIHVEKNLTYYDHTGDENDGLTYFEIHLCKTETSRREVPMLDFVKDAFLEEKRWQEESGQHCNTHVDGFQNFIFFNRFQKPHEPGYMNRILNRLVRNCNDELSDKFPDEDPVHHLSCHAFRHTFVTRMLEQGVSPLVVQAIVGHKDVQTTVSIYWDIQKNYQFNQLGMEDIKSEKNIFFKALSKSGQELNNESFLNAYMPAKLKAAQAAKTIL